VDGDVALIAPHDQVGGLEVGEVFFFFKESNKNVNVMHFSKMKYD